MLQQHSDQSHCSTPGDIVVAPSTPSSTPNSQPPSPNAPWNYEEAFARNRGLISPSEQEVLRNSRVAIPGMGGVGGLHLMTLSRMGIGKFRVADADEFACGNFNRQFGATVSNIGRPKTEVLSESAQGVNPEAEIDVMNEFVTLDNVDQFLDGVDFVVDALDFFAFEARKMLFREAARRGIWVVTAGPIGFSTAWLAFDPNGMTFDQYFDLRDGMEPVDQFAAFVVGLTPRGTHGPYFDYSYVQQTGQGPSVAAACRLAAGVVGAEAVKILLGRGKVRAAPHYQQFDAYRYILRKGWMPMGNRNPLQRLKRVFLRRHMLRLGYA